MAVRRISIAGGAIVVSLVVAAVAFASTTVYSGSFASSGSLSFKLSQRHGEVRLFSLAFKKFPLKCQGGPNTETAALKPSYRPLQTNYPKLRVLAIVTLPHHQKPLSTLLLTGMMHHEGKTASGKMRVHGRKVPTDNPAQSSDRCDSGKVHWSATSG